MSQGATYGDQVFVIYLQLRGKDSKTGSSSVLLFVADRQRVECVTSLVKKCIPFYNYICLWCVCLAYVINAGVSFCFGRPREIGKKLHTHSTFHLIVDRLFSHYSPFGRKSWACGSRQNVFNFTF